MAEQKAATAATAANPPAVSQVRVQKPVQSVAAVGQSQPTMHTSMSEKPVQNHTMVIKNERNTTAAQNDLRQARINRVIEHLEKLQSFLTKLTTLATAQSPEIGEAVEKLIKAVVVRIANV